MKHPPTTLWVGTSGYAYPEWKGAFYPADLSSKNMLRFYAERFLTTELNHTFYKMPSEQQLEAARAAVPEGFRFSVKVPASITHRKDAAMSVELLGVLVERLAALRERVGCLYFQLPATLPLDLPRLSAWLERLPHSKHAAVVAAIEMPHPSWHVEPVRRLLRARGAAWVLVDDVGAPPRPTLRNHDGLARSLESATVYLRLRRRSYAQATLAHWSRLLRAAAPAHAYVYFKHEDGARGPRLADRFLEAWRG